MNILSGRTFAAVLIAGLLALASAENHADDLDSYLDNAMRVQVLAELKENVQRLYEGTALVLAKRAEDESRKVTGFGFPIADRGTATRNLHRFGVLN